MSTDIHVRICKYDSKTNLYKELAIYRLREEDEKYEYSYDEEKNTWEKKEITNPYIKISPYDARNYEMFDGMKHGDETDGYGYFPCTSIALNSLEPSLRKDIEDKMNMKESYYDFYETSFADVEAYLYKHPTVVDYNLEWEEGEIKPCKDNPIRDFYQKCLDYTYFAERFGIYAEQPFSQYKILFWFSC
jgi:hypothetical protein